MKLLMLPLMALFLAACSGKTHELKSPCAGADDSPCGPRYNVNDWWLKKHPVIDA